MTGYEVPVPYLGALLSTLLYLGCGVMMAQLVHRSSPLLKSPLLPQSIFATFLFLWSPASYVFQSHHTESLYLLLSLGAFLRAEQKSQTSAAILAGLCALTKNQGIFLAVAIGYSAALTKSAWREKIEAFIRSGLISGGIFAIFPLYSWIKTGDLGSFYTAQHHWRPEMTISSWFKALIFANPWQNTNMGSIQRYLCFWLLFGTVPAIWRKHRPLGLYTLLFVLVMPMSGEFVGTFRYAAVLWPAWFTLSDILLQLPRRRRYVALAIVVPLCLYLNHQMTRNYGLGRWAY